jgi:hypothetical protein
MVIVYAPTVKNLTIHLEPTSEIEVDELSIVIPALVISIWQLFVPSAMVAVFARAGLIGETATKAIRVRKIADHAVSFENLNPERAL